MSDLSQGGGTPFAEAPTEAQLAILAFLNAHEALVDVLRCDVTLALVKVQLFALGRSIQDVLQAEAPANTVVPHSFDTARMSEAAAASLTGGLEVPDHVPDLWPEGGML